MQHKILVDQLESYLAGNAPPEFQEHLARCEKCREEVAGIENVTEVFRGAFDPSLRQTEQEGVYLRPGFYNRLASHIVEKQQSEAWGLFSPGVDFFRRIAFASLLVLAGLGGFLVTREASAGGADAVAIMAQHDVSTEHAESSDRERLLVTLANYHE